jgi:ATP-dependent RNA helicase DDX3X
VPKPTREEDIARARQFLFPEQVPFDYATANVSANEALGLSWFSNAKVYEWTDDYGDVGPADPDLEKELFHSQFHSEQGSQMSNLTYFDVQVEGAAEIKPIRQVSRLAGLLVYILTLEQYKDAALHPVILDNINKYGYKNPTPVQCYSIPAALRGYDVFGIAQAGSGKTAAYLLPIASKLMGKYKKLAAPRPGLGLPADEMVTAEPLALVIVPTRELATQIFDHTRRICYRSMLRPVVVYGGAPPVLQRKELQRGCDILIATPGRLQDFLRKDRLLTLRRLKYVSRPPVSFLTTD